MKRLKFINASLIITIILLIQTNSFGDDWKRIVNLRGDWKFSIGDNIDCSSPDFNDSEWEEIFAPTSWEDEGFYGYDGYAWYRKVFILPSDYSGELLYLSLGYVDDVDETYVNGHLVGSSGSFPPDYETAYNAYRRYPLPSDYLNKNGENVIAIRVYDERISGGIVSGDLGLFANTALKTDLNLEGLWKFKPGDSAEWKQLEFDDSNWDKIIVPANWETQGYERYDGYGWYRNEFILPAELYNEKLVLVLGKIDDVDEVYLNGKFLGSTGNPQKGPEEDFQHDFHNEWQHFRDYYIPEGMLIPNGRNVIAIRVYDGYLGGGIYQGPIGLVDQKDYDKYSKNNKKKKKSIWEFIFGN